MSRLPDDGDSPLLLPVANLDLDDEGRASHRSVSSQIEFWASIGRHLAPVLSPKDLVAIGQGARISIEARPSPRIDPDIVFSAVAQHQNAPFMSTAASPAPFQYEASALPGYIDRVDADGSRVTGKMIDGQFVSMKNVAGSY